MSFSLPAIVHTCFFIAAALLQPSLAKADDQVLWPKDAAALMRAEADLRALAIGHTKGFMRREAEEILTLLAAKRLPTPNRLSLDGPCRVRSLQAAGHGVFAYNDFACNFVREGRAGLRFEKKTGSQRRIGLVLEEAANKPALLFVGASYTTGEAPVHYSRLDSAVKEGGAPRDSVGLLYQVGAGRYIVIFAKREGRSEIYEITRKVSR